MLICRWVRGALKHVSHWVEETYCAIGQQVGERFEAVSDGLAEQRYLSEVRSEPSRSTASSGLPEVQVPRFRLINGHKYER
jgi:hypothetical protein